MQASRTLLSALQNGIEVEARDALHQLRSASTETVKLCEGQQYRDQLTAIVVGLNEQVKC